MASRGTGPDAPGPRRSAAGSGADHSRSMSGAVVPGRQHRTDPGRSPEAPALQIPPEALRKGRERQRDDVAVERRAQPGTGPARHFPAAHVPDSDRMLQDPPRMLDRLLGARAPRTSRAARRADLLGRDAHEASRSRQADEAAHTPGCVDPVEKALPFRRQRDAPGDRWRRLAEGPRARWRRPSGYWRSASTSRARRPSATPAARARSWRRRGCRPDRVRRRAPACRVRRACRGGSCRRRARATWVRICASDGAGVDRKTSRLRSRNTGSRRLIGKPPR